MQVRLLKDQKLALEKRVEDGDQSARAYQRQCFDMDSALRESRRQLAETGYAKTIAEQKVLRPRRQAQCFFVLS